MCIMRRLRALTLHNGLHNPHVCSGLHIAIILTPEANLVWRAQIHLQVFANYNSSLPDIGLGALAASGKGPALALLASSCKSKT